MIKVSEADIMKAAESLSFKQALNAHDARSVARMPEAEATKLASQLVISSLSHKQASVADDMGRALARVKMAAKIPSPLMRAGKALMSEAKGIATGKPIKSLFRPVPMKDVATKNRKLYRKGRKTPLTGMEALGHRWRTQPEQVAKGVLKGVVLPGAALYGGYRALRSNGD